MIHKSEIPGYENKMSLLVEEIGDLRYDRLADFLNLLSSKIQNDGNKDLNRGRVRLANSLSKCSEKLQEAKEVIDVSWRISEPYMSDYE